MNDNDAAPGYAFWVTDTIRYGDTDRQGHVNNAVFSTFLESGRVAFLYGGAKPILAPGQAFVIARLELDFKAELNWPGNARIGTSVLKIGRSSFRLAQAIFQNGTCCASAQTVMVLMDEATRKSAPLTDAIIARLTELQATPATGP